MAAGGYHQFYPEGPDAYPGCELAER